MDDEAAIAPLVAARQCHETAENTFAGDAPARAQSKRGIVKNCKDDKSEQSKTEQRQEVANFPCKQNSGNYQRPRRGPKKIALEIVPGSFAPSDNRADAHKKNEQEKKRNNNRIEIGRADAYLH